MKKLYHILTVFVLLTTTIYSQGSEYSLDFDGSNDYVDLGATGISLGASFTLEAWIYSSQPNGSWHGFMGNQVTGSTNRAPGLWVYENDRIHFGFGNGTTWQSGNTDSGTLIEDQWNHVAMTYQGSELKVYINGVLETTKTGVTGTPVNPLRWIGRVDNYFEGKIDEVRVWSVTRSEADLKTYMCQKLTGSETGLEGYWRFDDATGTTATDETTNAVDGTLTNMNSGSDWVTSGAPVGDASAYLYTGSWTGEILSLTSTNKGNIEINTVSGTPDGVHVYRVDETPNSVSGITNALGSNDIYYGVYVTGGSSPTYTVEFDYGLYANAMAAEPNVELYNRTDNEDTSWSLLSATLDTGANTLTETSNSGVNQEFLLGGVNSTEVLGYLGPGGVGNTDGSTALELWLRGDSGVTSDGSDVVTAWLDKSGNGNDVTLIGGDPTYTTTINNHEVVSLDGTDYFQSSVTSNTGTTASVYFAGTITGYSATWAGIISGSKSGQLDWNTTDHVVFLNRYDSSDDIESHRDGVKSVVSNGLSGSSVKIMNSEYDGSNSIIRLDGVASTSVSSTGSFDYNLIGIGKRITETKYTEGDYAEVIYFDKDLNLAQKIIIENYLQAKYDGALSANDFYNEDNSANGDFDYDVAGIGQATDGSNHTDSQGTGIVRINNPRGLGNDEFLFWGRNNQTALAFETNTSNYKERLNTVWRASRRNNPGRVDVTFDLNGVDLSGMQSCSFLQLIVDNNSDLLSPPSGDIYPLTDIGGGLYRAENVRIRNNRYFTLEYQDKIVVDDTQFYNGSGTANVPDINDGCFKLLVKSTADGSLTLTENANVREVEVESGGKLVVSNGTRLQVTDGIDNSGDIRLIGTSQLLQTHTGVSQNLANTGNLYIDQQGTNNSKFRYNYWSSPVVGVGQTQYTIGNVLKDGSTPTGVSTNPLGVTFTSGYDGDHTTNPITISSYWLYKFDANWSQVGTTGTLDPGQGYTMKGPGAVQGYTFVGIPNDGDYTVAVLEDNSALVGNPYPSALDADAFIQLNSVDNGIIDGSIYFWEHNGETSTTGNEGHHKLKYQGGYAVRNIGGGVAAVAPPGVAGLGSSSGIEPEQYIPVAQGFFVNAIADGDVEFNNSMRAFVVEGSESVFYKNGKKNQITKSSHTSKKLPSIRIGFDQKNENNILLRRQLLTVFKEGLTDAYDNAYDSGIYDIQSNDAYWKFSEEEGSYVIAGVNTYSVEKELPLEVVIGTEGVVSFEVLEKLDIVDKVYLYDKLNDIYYGLNDDRQVSLFLEEGAHSDRFFITFKGDGLLSTPTVDLAEMLLVYQDSRTNELLIHANSEMTISKIVVYDRVGVQQKVLEVVNSVEEDYKIDVQSFPSSVYIIRIETDQGVISKKVLIK
ncbi:LamG-like jellyroll fold domain-containing protein [Flavicella marina]|uniref:LamG-like jellyroll fold domain-containing protein n=1 Tax=Flavicella marina TaxID=1475951 RepID=UPI0012650FE4|nr:LamG-like jellyroll fold domain-containing protein [Flavicella marina]